MIKANELKIGNIINIESKYKRYNELFIEVESINSTEINTDFRPYELNHCIGIPLTEEILLKCGFEKSNDLDKFYHLDLLNEWTRIYFDPKHKVCTLSINQHDSRISIQYLHELQNLVFSLTKKELTIQL